jgi:hypothetical protein
MEAASADCRAVSIAVKIGSRGRYSLAFTTAPPQLKIPRARWLGGSEPLADGSAEPAEAQDNWLLVVSLAHQAKQVIDLTGHGFKHGPLLVAQRRGTVAARTL